jgi:tripartite-type tricarboxylate transporter receptor subunit TctC
MTIVAAMRSLLALTCFALVAALAPTLAHADYPERPITMVIAYPPGGGADALGRIVAAQMSNALRQPVTVVNKSGAGGTIGAAFVSGSAPDGYTIFFAESSLLVSPHLYNGLSYDPLASFTPVASVGALPFTIIANPQFPAKSLAELIVVLRANPGKYSYASPGVGNIGHLSAELFQQMANVSITHVPYQGGGKLVADVISGEVPLAFLSASPVLPLVKAGRVNLIAVTSPSRVPFAEGTPTVAEALPGFRSATNFFVLAPAKLPNDIRDTLAAAVAKVMTTREVDEAFLAQGATLVPGASDALAAQMKAEVAQWGQLVKKVGIKAQ